MSANYRRYAVRVPEDRRREVAAHLRITHLIRIERWWRSGGGRCQVNFTANAGEDVRKTLCKLKKNAQIETIWLCELPGYQWEEVDTGR